jgi:hypothetical protein
MPIVPLLANAAFDSETTHQLGLAFEAAWQAVKTSESPLGDESHAASTREILAKRVIEMGRRGERNHDRLVKNALDHLEKLREAPATAIITKSAPIPATQVR